MFKPGGVLWLLRHELRLSWRTWLSATRARGGRGRFVLYALLLALLGFGGYFVAAALSGVEPDPSPIVLGVIGGVFLLLFTFMLSQALMLITEALYQRGDIDLLLASPLPPWRILIVRMGAVAINVATFYLILAAAVFIWLPLFGGWRWMGFLPSVLALALFSVGVALVIARLLFRVVGPRTTRVAAQIVASLIGAGFFLALQAQNYVSHETRAQVYAEMFARLEPIFGDAVSPISLPARAALGLPFELAAWLVGAIAVFVLGVWWFASGFIGNASAIAGAGSPSRRRKDLRVRKTRSGATVSLVRKEWRLILRDPLLLSQILLPLLYFIPLFFIFAGRLNGEGLGDYALPGFVGAFVLISTTLAASLAWLTISAEDAPDLIAAAPVSRDQIELGKAIAAAAPVLVLVLAPAIMASMANVFAGVWLMLGAACAVTSACLIAIWYQRPGSRKNFRRRTQAGFFVNMGQAFITLCWVAATSVSVSGWAIIAIIPALIALGLLLALHESRPKPV